MRTEQFQDTLQKELKEIEKQFENISAFITNQYKTQQDKQNIQKIDYNDKGNKNQTELNQNEDKSKIQFDLKSINQHHRNIFHEAAYNHQKQQVQNFLIPDPIVGFQNAHIKDRYGNTALNLALIQRFENDKNEQLKLVKMLVSLGQQKDTQEADQNNISNNNEYGEENVDQVENQSSKDPPAQGIDVNMSNNHTLFTPLHWACFHGAMNITSILLQSGAKQYLPDIDGFFPIDYAGMFGHHQVVKLLITTHFQHIGSIIKDEEKKVEILNQIEIKSNLDYKKLRTENLNFMRDDANKILNSTKIEVIKEYLKDYNLVPLNPENTLTKLGVQAPLMFSPVFNTRMLYWASYFNEISLDYVKTILSESEAYPEGPVDIRDGRTPIHAAAQVGNIDKLKLLLEEVKERYQEVDPLKPKKKEDEWWQTEVQQQVKYRRRNLYPFEQSFSTEIYGQKNREHAQTLLKTLNMLLQSAHSDEILRLNQTQFEIGQGQKATIFQIGSPAFTYDFLDFDLNTPLHLASQYTTTKLEQPISPEVETTNNLESKASFKSSQVECIELLLSYGLHPDLRNEDGLMPMDMIRTEEARQVYKKWQKSEIMSTAVVPKVVPASGKTGAVLPEPVPGAQGGGGKIESLRNQEKREVLRDNHIFSEVPPLVLKVSASEEVATNQDKKGIDIVNAMINLMVAEKFQVALFQSLEKDAYFIGLNMKDQDIENEAEQMNFRVKLFGINANKVYNSSIRERFEPFRMKDIQLIMMHRLKRIINLHYYTEINIILSVIPMHDFSGIADIRGRWYRQGPNFVEESRCKKFFVIRLFQTMPFPMIQQFFQEGSHYNYNELSAVKNYFGEKVGFHYVWVSFYTIWLFIPVIAGVAITIYQMVTGVDTSMTSIFSLLISIWVTIFIERWKRKCSEICLKWGLADMMNNDSSHSRIERDDFIGYEYLNHDSQRIEKKTIFQKSAIAAFILQGPAILLLLFCCIATFFGHNRIKAVVNGSITKENAVLIKFLSFVSGMINSIVISIFDYIQSKLAQYFVNLENHKYEDSFEKSYVFKVFFFQFFNTNISILYTAFRGYYDDGTDGDGHQKSREDRFNELYFMLLGMAATKAVTIYFTRHVKRMILYQIKKWMYFKKLGDTDPLIPPMRILKADIPQIINKEKGAISQMISETPTYQRAILYADKNQENKKIFVDYIELNDRMSDSTEFDFINERSDVFILFNMATLYACACPIVPLIALLHNIADMNMDIHVRYTATKRPFAKVDKNIGPWLTITQFLAVAAVISNCAILFFSTNSLKDWIETQMGGKYEEVYVLWIIIGIEHFIIVIKEWCAEAIDDEPTWVKKALQRVEGHKKDMSEHTNKEYQKQIDAIESAKEGVTQQIESINKQMIEKLKENEKLQKEKNSIFKQYQYEKEKSGINKEDQLLLEWAKQISSQPTSIGGLYKLCITSEEWLANQRQGLFDQEIGKNMIRRLLQQSFMKTERDIMISRINKLFDTSSTTDTNILSVSLQINCAQCQQSLASVECFDCMDHFCKVCVVQMHSDIFNNHRIQELNSQITEAEKKKGPRWKKFEYFNFPIHAENASHQKFKWFFEYMKHVYIKSNYIESTSKLNLVSLFVDQNYEILTENKAQTLQKRDLEHFGQLNENLLKSRKSFNDEELYYMNKIAFYLFSTKQSSAEFNQFVNLLSNFQYGQFLTRLNIWLHILCEERRNTGIAQSENIGSVDFVLRTQIEEVLKFSYLQSRFTDAYDSLTTTDHVLDFIFSGQKQISTQAFIEAIQRRQEVQEYFFCLLQFTNN